METKERERPEPVEGGKIVWEDWESVDHTNFIYVRHRATACS